MCTWVDLMKVHSNSLSIYLLYGIRKMRGQDQEFECIFDFEHRACACIVAY